MNRSMNRNRKMKGNVSSVWVYAVCLLLVLTVSACSSGASKNSGKQNSPSAEMQDGATMEKTPPENSAPVPAPESAELYIVVPAGDGWGAEEIYGSKFRNKFPHFTFHFVFEPEIDKLILSGTPMDLVSLSSTRIYHNYTVQGLNFDISGLIKKHDYDLSQLNPSVVETFSKTGEGAIIGLPDNMNVSKMMYNKDIFDKFGIDYPTDHMTWDEAFELSNKITRTADDVLYRGFAMLPQAIINLNQLSAAPVNPATNHASFLANNDWIDIFNNMARFFRGGNAVDPETVNLSVQYNMWAVDRTVGMYVNYGMGPADMNWDMVTLPTFDRLPGGGSQVILGGWLLPVTSKYKDAAFQVLVYIVSEEMQTYYATLGWGPVLSSSKAVMDALGEAETLKGKNLKAMFPDQIAAGPEFTPFNDISYAQLFLAFDEVLTGSKDVNTALREAEEKANAEIDEMLSRQ